MTRQTQLQKWAGNAALFLFIIYLVMLGARLNWVFDLFSHFRIQYAIGVFLFLIAACLIRSWRSVFIAALLMSVNLFDIYRFADFTASEKGDFTVVQYNHLYKNGRLGDVEDWLKGNRFDVVILQEATQATVEMGERLKQDYPHQIAKPQADAFGMVILSRHSFRQSEILPVPGPLFDNFMIRAVIDMPGRNAVTVFALHAVPPTSSLQQRQRNGELKTASEIIAGDGSTHKIFAGDWNITPYSPYFHDVLETTGLRNSFVGLNPGATWPQNLGIPLTGFPLPFLRIPIDQVLFSDSLELADRKTGPAMGSDHAPVIANFSFRK